MNYHELVEKVKKGTQKAIVSKTVEHVAFQFDVEGDAKGVFYLEISDGKISVEPYEYYDRDVIIVSTAEVIMQMLEGDLQPMAAYTNELIKVQGDMRLLEVLPLGNGYKKKK